LHGNAPVGSRRVIRIAQDEIAARARDQEVAAAPTVYITARGNRAGGLSWMDKSPGAKSSASGDRVVVFSFIPNNPLKNSNRFPLCKRGIEGDFYIRATIKSPPRPPFAKGGMLRYSQTYV